MHIFTNKTLLADAIHLENSKGCVICGHKNKEFATYYGVLCTNCNVCIGDEYWRGSIAMKKREYLKISRKEMAKIYKVKTKTIRQYEYVKCPSSYIQFIEKLIKRRLATFNRVEKAFKDNGFIGFDKAQEGAEKTVYFAKNEYETMTVEVIKNKIIIKN